MQRVQRSQPGLPTFPGRETHRLNLSLRRAAVAALVVLAAVLFGGGAAWAAVLVNNLDETELTTGSLAVSPTQHLSQGFKTASGGSPTTLTSIDIRLKAAAAMAAPPTVTVHREAQTGPQLASLTGPTSIAAGTTNVTFTAPPGTLLTPGTTYQVLLQHTVANSIEAATTEANDQDGATGWTIWNNLRVRSGPTGNFTAQALAPHDSCQRHGERHSDPPRAAGEIHGHGAQYGGKAELDRAGNRRRDAHHEIPVPV